MKTNKLDGYAHIEISVAVFVVKKRLVLLS